MRPLGAALEGTLPTRRDDLERSLAQQDPEALALILDASGVGRRGAESGRDLAKHIVDAIWWSYSTPLGYYAERATLEDIVAHVARKLRVSDRVDPDVPVWDQVTALTTALLDEIPSHGVSVDDLDADTRARLRPQWLPPLGFGVSSAGSFAGWWGSGKVLDLLKSPIGRLLPLLPYVGPWVGAVRTGLSAVHLVTGPLGIALAVLSLNSALGANYAKLVPLLLGVGALRPTGVDDADEVPVASTPTEAEAEPAPAVGPDPDPIATS